MGPNRAQTGSSFWRRLWRDHRAATAVEYGLIVALIVIAMIAAMSTVANVTTGMWNTVSTKIANAK